MPDESHLTIQRGEFFCDPLFPRFILGLIFVWHLWIPQFVCSPKYVSQICHQFLVFLVCSLPATVNEQHLLFHGLSSLLFVRYNDQNRKRGHG
jgi:hypothetical protein